MKLLTPKDPEWPMLFERAALVADIATQVRPHIHEMRQIMKAHNAIGLAAPQVGIPLRFFLTDVGDKTLEVVINPEITYYEEDATSRLEGCLSWDAGRKTTYVRRSDMVGVNFTTLNGHVPFLDIYGLASRVFQHEFDHLNGVTIFPNPCPRTQPSLA